MSRQAPPVHLVVVPDRRWQRVRQVCAVLVSGGCVVWAWSQGQPNQPTGWSAVVCPVLAVLLALSVWPRSEEPARPLDFDGAQWAIDARPCSVRVAIDLGAWLLLRVSSSAAAPRWIALSESDHAGAWHSLRCALYCARPSPLTPTAGPGAVSPPDER